jgi:hypothetical protein
MQYFIPVPLVGLIALAAGRLVAQVPELTPDAAFAAGLASVRAKLDDHQGAEAQADLLRLLEQHQGSPCALARRDEIVELASAAHFGDKVTMPGLQDVLRGRVTTFDARTRRACVHYKEFADWTHEGTVLTYPMVFSGPYSVTAKGSSYPSEPRTLAISFHCDETGKNWLAADFGLKADKKIGSRDIQARLLRGTQDRSGTGPEELAKADSPAIPHRPFEAVVRVTGHEILMVFNGRTVLRDRRDGADNGRIAVSDAPLEEVVVEGCIDADWLRGRIAVELGRRRAQIEPGFDVQQVLPAWLLAAQLPADKQPPPDKPKQ